MTTEKARPLLITANTPAAPVSIFSPMYRNQHTEVVDAKIKIVSVFRDYSFKKAFIRLCSPPPPPFKSCVSSLVND